MTRIVFDCFFCVFIALLVAAWQIVGPQGLVISFVPYIVCICWLSLAAGRLLSYWGGRATSSPMTDMIDFVGGSFLLQLFLFLCVYIFHFSVLSALLPASVLLLCTYYVFHKRILPSDYGSRQSVYILLILLLILGAAGLWSRQALTQYLSNDISMFFQPNIDCYIHTGVFLPFTRGDYSLANFFFSGEKIYFYHYGSYMFSAAAVELGVESALDLTTSFWLPFGVFLMGLSAFGLGYENGGFTAGCGAVFALLLVPDASTYLFSNQYFSFHWLLQLSPGCAYGLAFAAYGFVWLIRYKREQRRCALCIALFVLVAMIFIRAHFLPLFVGVVIIWILLFASNLQPVKRAVFAVLALAVLPLRPWVVSHLTMAPSLVGPPGGSVFIPMALTSKFGDGNYFGLAGMVIQADSQWIQILGGIVLMTMSMLGAYLFLTFLLMVNGMIRGRSIPYWDSLPWIALFCYSFLAWFLPISDRTNRFELAHRPFVLVYFLFAVWLGSHAFSRFKYEKIRSWKYGVLSLLIVAGLFSPWHYGRAIHGGQLSRVPMQKGIYEAALFLREHSQQGDVFVDTGLNYYGTIGVMALSETIAFFSPTMASFVNRNRPQFRDRFQKRLVFRKQLNNTTSAVEACRLAHNKGIRWAIIQDGHHSEWEADAAGAKVFEAHNTRVYDMLLLGGNKKL